ncbi:MAG: hypothetical protein LBL82_04630 [Oscillospiraceae bacterium]|jgi:hypothetical protein|nr:hypothetical protein [Oscillospiraceae bacterium]
MKTISEWASDIEKKVNTKRLSQIRYRKITLTLISAAACIALVAISVFAVVGDGNLTAPESDGKGVTVPAIEIQKPEEGVRASMIALFVYQGKVYTYINSVSEPADAENSLIGEHLGTAAGNLNEWSEDEDYTADFSASVSGEVHTLNGYDPSYKLCVAVPSEGGVTVDIYANLNGITLVKGEDLYGESRENLKGNYIDAAYLTHDKWDSGSTDMTPLEDSEDFENLSAFIDELYSSPFVTYEEIYESEPNQLHIYLTMNNGTTLGLRLYEGGYVGFDQMLGYAFVKMDSPVFDAVFALASAE